MSFPLTKEAKPLKEIVKISSRLGEFKIEHSDVISFTAQQAKTYAFQTTDGTKILKAKGFKLFQRLAEANNMSGIIEESLGDALSVFSSLHTVSNKKLKELQQQMAILVFQKSFLIDPKELIPSIPKNEEENFKKLMLIGPRRQVIFSPWVMFNLEITKEDPIQRIISKPSKKDHYDHENSNHATFKCSDLTPIVHHNKKKTHVKILPLENTPFLPTYPYGYEFDDKNHYDFSVLKNILK